MEYIKGITEFLIKGKSAITLGKFDGLHRGHQKLTHKILSKKAEGYQAVIFTFAIPPLSLLKHQHPKVLLTNQEKRYVFERIGIDYLIEFPFDEKIAKMEPEEFVKTVLVDKVNAGYIAVGSDFRFGHNRRGDYKLLGELGKTYGFEVEVVEKEQFEGRDISSTFVKEEVEKGNIEKVSTLLGRPFSIIGEVLHGRKIGRTLGMPTANLIPPKSKLLPPNGVYVSKTKIEDGHSYEGITSIGYNPTVGEKSYKTVETYLFGLNEDIYGEIIEVDLYTYERPEMKFNSLEELREKMQSDMEFGKAYFKNYKKEKGLS